MQICILFILSTIVNLTSEIDDKKVVAIADNAFTSRGVAQTNISNTKKVETSYLYIDNKTLIHKLKITIKGLGITSVVIPNTVKSIGADAFFGNKNIWLNHKNMVLSKRL